jgi:hypothetical protein
MIPNHAHASETVPGVVPVKSHSRKIVAVTVLAATVMVASASRGFAQTLNWKGQTGIFVTTLAYTAPSIYKGLGVPVVSYH